VSVQVPNRPPDRIAHGPWEAPPENPAALRRRMVASEWTLFKVLEYTEVIDDPRPWQRRHMEFWEIPEERTLVAGEADAWGDHQMDISVEVKPSQTIGRWRWESEGSDCAHVSPESQVAALSVLDEAVRG
jgi:hypothetical protein